MAIKTFAEACKKLKLDPKKVLPDVSSFPEKDQDALLAHAKLIIIARALNDGWQPDWDNGSEYKYYPWFWMDKPGFRFLVSYCDITYSLTSGGSRLCFKTRALSDYAAKQFEKLYRDMMVIQK